MALRSQILVLLSANIALASAVAATQLKAPPPTRRERLIAMGQQMTLQQLMKSGTSLEQTLRTKLMESPIFKTKLSWECRQAQFKEQRNMCEWKKAAMLFCKMMPQAAPKLAKIMDIESAAMSLMDTLENSMMFSAKMPSLPESWMQVNVTVTKAER